MCLEEDGGREGWCADPVRRRVIKIRLQRMKMKILDLVEVDYDAANVCSANRHHAEKSVFPSPKQRHTFVQHEQVFQSFCHPGRN